jgi:SAM-dependent methyltransferase
MNLIPASFFPSWRLAGGDCFAQARWPFARPSRWLLAAPCAILALAFSGCSQPEAKPDEPAKSLTANDYMNESGFRDLVDRFEAPDRNEWQCPDLIMDQLGPLQGKTVMDLGAGTGYFSVRFVDAGAKVIAADVDQRFLDFLTQRAEGLGYGPEQLQMRRVPYNSPSLAKGEVDLFFTCNTYHHIESRERYFQEVRSGLAPGGRVAIVDFQGGSSPHGPPPAMRVGADVMQRELKAAGFRRVAVDSTTLPEQVLVIAWP